MLVISRGWLPHLLQQGRVVSFTFSIFVHNAFTAASGN